ncbi:MAG: nitrilase-related carbon-nitrogen hydrolase [Acidobacteriota bacterium]
MKIAIAQIASVVGDLEANLNQHLQIVEHAVTARADLVIFPELSLTGYDVRERAPEFAVNAQSSRLRPIVEASAEIDVHLGFIEQGDDFRIFNSSLYAARGFVRAVHRKTYLPTYGRFDEGRYFAAGDTVRAFDLCADESRLAKSSGVGTLRTGSIICEELWHPSVAWLLGQDGAQLLLVQAAASVPSGSAPGAVPAALQSWEALAVSAAISCGAFVVVANRVGSEADFNYFGCSFVANPTGEVTARAEGAESKVLLVEADFAEVGRARTSMPLLRDERLDLTGRELERISRRRFGVD